MLRFHPGFGTGRRMRAAIWNRFRGNTLDTKLKRDVQIKVFQTKVFQINISRWIWLLILIAPIRSNAVTADDYLDQIHLQPRLNERVNPGLAFHDSSGRWVQLGDYLNGRPLIMALAYYNCPNLCGLVLEGLVKGLRELDFTAGREFEIVIVSIDPRETPAQAKAAKSAYLARYDRSGTEHGWHFLTADDNASRQLAESVGFNYAYDPGVGQYAHPAALVLLTGEGRVARYLTGVEYAARDLRLGLLEASQGRIGSPMDQVLLRCYGYDLVTGAYSPRIIETLQYAGSLTVAALIGIICWLLCHESDKRDALRKRE